MRRLRQLCKSKNPEMIFLCETLCKKEIVATKLCNLGFPNFVGVDSEGRSGGLILAWSSLLSCDVISLSKNWILTRCTDQDNHVFYITCVYGPPRISERHEFWAFLRTVARNVDLPWIVGGDFNQVLSKNSQSPGAIELSDTLNNCGLIELHTTGNFFTWCNGRQAEDTVWEKLDRILVNADWFNLFPQSHAECLTVAASDHCPILLSTVVNFAVRRRPKRFEAMWITDPGCHDIVKNAWNVNENGSLAFVVAKKIKNTMNSLIRWSNDSFGNIPNRIKCLNQELENIQKGLHDSSNLVLLEIERNVRNELERLLELEEIQWAQRAHQLWLVFGDRNTKYFHAVVRKRRVSNCITKLQDDDGNWIDKQEDLEKFILSYYKHVFEFRDEKSFNDIVVSLNDLNFPQLSNEDCLTLTKVVEEEEVKREIF